MTSQQKKLDFEEQWQNKLSEGIDQNLGDGTSQKILVGGENLSDESPASERINWTCQALDRLAQTTDDNTLQEILTQCACQYPVEDLQDIKAAYIKNRDVDQAISMLQGKFEVFLRETLELEDELVQIILAKGWGVAGVQDEERNRIISTKIPKSGFLRQYFDESDPLQKRRHYCHCPRVRDGLDDEPVLPQNYCYCGAGFYKGIWEEILGEPVEVEMLESVIQGDQVCKIAIKLPK